MAKSKKTQDNKADQKSNFQKLAEADQSVEEAMHLAAKEEWEKKHGAEQEQQASASVQAGSAAKSKQEAPLTATSEISDSEKLAEAHQSWEEYMHQQAKEEWEKKHGAEEEQQAEVSLQSDSISSTAEPKQEAPLVAAAEKSDFEKLAEAHQSVEEAMHLNAKENWEKAHGAEREQIVNAAPQTEAAPKQKTEKPAKKSYVEQYKEKFGHLLQEEKPQEKVEAKPATIEPIKTQSVEAAPKAAQPIPKSHAAESSPKRERVPFSRQTNNFVSRETSRVTPAQTNQTLFQQPTNEPSAQQSSARVKSQRGMPSVGICLLILATQSEDNSVNVLKAVYTLMSAKKINISTMRSEVESSLQRQINANEVDTKTKELERSLGISPKGHRR